MATKFVPNQAGIAALGRSAPLGLALKSMADEAAQGARGVAPVLSGAYAGSITTEVGVEGPTVVARINANDFKSGFIEFGTSDTPTFAPLRRGCDSAGLSLGGAK